MNRSILIKWKQKANIHNTVAIPCLHCTWHVHFKLYSIFKTQCTVGRTDLNYGYLSQSLMKVSFVQAPSTIKQNKQGVIHNIFYVSVKVVGPSPLTNIGWQNSLDLVINYIWIAYQKHILLHLRSLIFHQIFGYW